MSTLPSTAEQSGTPIGRYEVERVLATRGGATWFLAKTKGSPDKQVVLQRVVRGPQDVSFAYAEFLERARAQARLRHPNVVRVLEVGSAGDDPLVVFEYVLGWSLEEVVGLCASVRHALPLGFGCSVMADALRGLEAAHRVAGHPLVHGGLDLSEIRVTPEGVGKVKGFARLQDRTRGRYRSPEELRGEPLVPASDVFSAGLMLQELLTGRPVLSDLPADVTASALLYAPLVDPREVNPGLDPELAELVVAAVARDRSKRIQSASEFVRRLEVAAQKVSLPPPERAQFLEWLDAQEDLTELSPRPRAAKPTPLPVAETPLLPPRVATPPPPQQPSNLLRPLLWTFLAGALAGLAGGIWHELQTGGEFFKGGGGMERLPETSVLRKNVPSGWVPGRVEPSLPPSPPIPAPRPEPQGQLTVVTTPVAEVRFRGQFLGRTPLFQERLPLGVQVLEFTLPDGRKKHVPVTVVAGRNPGVRLDLTGP